MHEYDLPSSSVVRTHKLLDGANLQRVLPSDTQLRVDFGLDDESANIALH